MTSPSQQPDPPQADDAGGGMRMQKFDPPQTTRPTASVLVVDASPLALLATAGVLDAQGYRCTCARTAEMAVTAVRTSPQDLIVWDVGDDAAVVLETLTRIRTLDNHHAVPALLIAESTWAGLEKRVESMPGTACLFKPIDPTSLIAVAERLLWMPALTDAHRRRGTRPSRPGWVSL